MSKLLSIITVSFNSYNTIRETIESVKSIKSNEIEYIVVDGNSKDGTQDIVNSYQGIVDTFISEKDSGLYDAMNKGINLATAEFCIFLNSDDYLNTKEFQEALNKIKQFKEKSEWFFGNVDVINESGLKVGQITPNSQTQESKQMFNMPVAFPAAFLRTSSLIKINGFKLNYGSCCDFDLILRYIEAFGPGEKIDQNVICFRLGGISTHFSSKRLFNHWNIWSDHNYSIFGKVRHFSYQSLSYLINTRMPYISKQLKRILKRESFIAAPK